MTDTNTIGRMRHYLTVQEEVLSPDAGGGFTSAWQDITTTPKVYAEVLTLGGTYQPRLHQMAATATHHLRLHYRRDIAAGMRLVEGSTVYYILHAADTDGTEKFLTLLAETRSI